MQARKALKAIRRSGVALAVVVAATATIALAPAAQARPAPSITINSVSITAIPGDTSSCNATVQYTVYGVKGNLSQWAVTVGYVLEDGTNQESGAMPVTRKSVGTPQTYSTTVPNDGSTSYWTAGLYHNVHGAYYSYYANQVTATDSC